MSTSIIFIYLLLLSNLFAWAKRFTTPPKLKQYSVLDSSKKEILANKLLSAFGEMEKGAESLSEELNKLNISLSGNVEKRSVIYYAEMLTHLVKEGVLEQKVMFKDDEGNITIFNSVLDVPERDVQNKTAPFLPKNMTVFYTLKPKE